MTTSRHFLSPIGAAGLATTRRFACKALGKASLPERHRTPRRPLEVNYPADAGFHDENGDPNAGRWLGPSRATVHAQGGPRYRVGSVARANRRRERSADCKISPML